MPASDPKLWTAVWRHDYEIGVLHLRPTANKAAWDALDDILSVYGDMIPDLEAVLSSTTDPAATLDALVMEWGHSIGFDYVLTCISAGS